MLSGTWDLCALGIVCKIYVVHTVFYLIRLRMFWAHNIGGSCLKT